MTMTGTIELAGLDGEHRTLTFEQLEDLGSQVEGQAARRHGGSGDVVAAALDAEQQPMLAGEPDGGGDVVGRGRLEDQGGEPGRHAVPDRNGLVPTLVASTQQPTLDP